jgi:cation diffusion facilitator CzcD-associated flavoprotein CzcO
MILEAHSYQYTFAPNLNWSSFYAPAKEIRNYLEDIVRRYSVDRFIKCSHRVTDARWDADKSKWYAALRSPGVANSPF